MGCHYLVRCGADLPQCTDWLTPPESRVYRSLRSQKRKFDWLLGRWTVKSALQLLPGIPRQPMTAWQVLPAASGAPALLLHGERQDIGLSLSHSEKRAFCVMSTHQGALGCDIEAIEDRGPTFEETYFTANERDRLDRSPESRRPLLASLVWSAKESALKILGLGLRADTRRIEVDVPEIGPPESWAPLSVNDIQATRRFEGWWGAHDGMVQSILAEYPPGSLTCLDDLIESTR